MQREVIAARSQDGRDLGALDGPVLVFGGPYSNLEAARATRAEAVRLGIPYARTLEDGLWPPVDFLPPTEQAAAGRPLGPLRNQWPLAEQDVAA